MPAGDLRVALGAFYKEDKYEYAASPVASVFLPAPDGLSGRTSRASMRRTTSAATTTTSTSTSRLLVPLLPRCAGVESLEAVLGYRLSDYASAGSFDSWKAELLYQPIESIRVRSSYQEAVRAAGVSSCICRSFPHSSAMTSFPGFARAMRGRQRAKERTGRRSRRGALPRAGCAGKSSAGLPGLGRVRRGVSRAAIPTSVRKRRPRRRWVSSGHRVRRIHSWRTCRCRSTGTGSTSRTGFDTWPSWTSCRTATTPLQPGFLARQRVVHAVPARRLDRRDRRCAAVAAQCV